MKGKRTLGMLVAALALVVLITGIVGANLDGNTGALGRKVIAAREIYAEISAHQKAASKTAPSAVKKASTALSGARSAVQSVEGTLADMQALHDEIENSETTGDEELDSLLAAAQKAKEGLTEENEGIADIESITAGMVLAKYADLAQDAFKAVNDAENKLITAQQGVADTITGAGLAYETDMVEVTDYNGYTTGAEYIMAVEESAARASELVEIAQAISEEASAAQETTNAVVAADSMDPQSRFILFVEANWLGFVFTSVLLFAVAIVLLFFAQKFAYTWRKAPVFSTAIALLVMVTIQTYALGFRFNTIGEWLTYWFNNAMNVLRANSSVGMIALGMTFVIISGGIDLAVGSTLAGVSTVVMCLIDVSQNGVLTKLGISGLPAYLIASFAGILAGVLFGAITGGIITKGRVPPFIVTLGMMQIIRSVAQYFTKSYTPEVPKSFQALANTVIGGQMLLPILYWLVLAILLYIVSRHTAFGRHVYAVGSNERTTMLSGINVDKVKMKVYVLMGFIVSLAAIAQVARLRGVDVASAGNGYEMNAIAAVVVGGTSMSGGKGSIAGTVLGVLIIGIMNNLLVLLSVDSFLSSAFTGAIVIAAVLMQRKEKTA